MFVFREQIWVIISVEVTGTLAITQQMSKLDHLGKFLQELNTCFSLSNPFCAA